MKTLALYASLLLTTLTAIPVSSGSEVDGVLTKQISDVLADCQKITPGMTRAELRNLFTVQGGLSTAAHRTYVYRGCLYIKIDVDFKVTDGEREEHWTDIVTKISRPYLEYTVAD